jgi:hippurate hydrolase
MCRRWRNAGRAKPEQGEMIHHPAYAFDDSIMPLGAAIFINIFRDRLGS